MGAIIIPAHRHLVRFSTAVTLVTMILAAILPLFLTHTTFAADDPLLAPPTVTLQTSPTQLKKVDPPVVDVSGTISDTDQLTYDLTVTDPANATTPLASGGMTDSVMYDWDTTGLTDGTYILTLTAHDALMQTGQASANVLIDRTGPEVAITSATNGTTYGGNNTTVTSTGTVSDATLASYQFDVSGDTGYTSTSGNIPAASGPATYAWDVSTEASGAHTYTITLTAIDSAGNETTTSQTVTLNIDNTPPQVTIGNDDESYIEVAVQPDTTTGEDSDTLTFAWTADSDNPDILTYSKTAAQPIFRPSIAGIYIFYVQVCDTLGNCTIRSFTFSWRPASIPVTSTMDTPAATPPPPAPATGLVATKFNTTDPVALGVQTSEGSAQTSSTTAPIDNEKPTTKQKNIEATYTTNNSDKIWLVLLVLAFGAAGYYAYRNWQLRASKQP